MKKLSLLFIFLAAVVLTSCWYNRKWDEIHPTPAGPGPGGCSDTAGITMSYSVHIVPLLQTNCSLGSMGCHKSGGLGGDLTTHASVSAFATSGQLAGSTQHQAPYSAMPKLAAKLPDCEIAKILKWIQSGSPNN